MNWLGNTGRSDSGSDTNNQMFGYGIVALLAGFAFGVPWRRLAEIALCFGAPGMLLLAV